MSDDGYRDFEVQLVVIINMPIVAQNPDFNTADAKDHAFSMVADAIENYTNGDVSLVEAKADRL
jgi:hypothetical protein